MIEGDMMVHLNKIASIIQWPIPNNVKKVRSFMGEAQYLINFIVNFSTLATPLNAITSEGK
jgi:hypothetical protein